MGTALLSDEELNQALSKRIEQPEGIDYLSNIEATMRLAFENHVSLHWNGSEWVTTGKMRTARSDNPLRAVAMVLVDEKPI